MEATVNGKFDKLTAGKADIWRDRIDAQRASGQSVRAWCQANDSREHSFYWWRSRLGLAPEKRRFRRRSKPITFAQVVVRPGDSRRVINASAVEATPAASFAEPLHLRFAGETQGGACVRELILPASMPLEQVARLVHAIEATP